MKNISVKGVDDADAYTIGKQLLKRGTVVKGYYPPSGPSGFCIGKIEHNNGFHLNHTYENKQEAYWSVIPKQGLFSNYWMETVK